MVAVAIEPRPDAPGAARPEEMASLPYQAPCWDQLEQKIIEWAYDPSALEDEDFEAPTREVIGAALRLVRQLRWQSKLHLSRVTPDGDGGLSFEERSGETTIIVNVTPEGMELMMFSSGALQARHRLS